MVRHWDPERDGKLPNCQQTENLQHLNLCNNRDRMRLLYGMVDNFAKRLSLNYAHPDIAYWITKYIKLCGIKKLGDFPDATQQYVNYCGQPKLNPVDMLHGRENIPGDFTASRVCPREISSPPLNCRLDQALNNVLTSNLPCTMGVPQLVRTRLHRWLYT